MTDIEIVGFKEYRKKTTIKAIQMNQPFRVNTLDGCFHGKAGDWLAEDVKGERYIIDNDVFEKFYELVEEPNEYEIKPMKL